jgi:hypothetical protein
MNYLFAQAPLFVPGMKMENYESRDLERRVQEAEEKQTAQHQE